MRQERHSNQFHKHARDAYNNRIRDGSATESLLAVEVVTASSVPDRNRDSSNILHQTGIRQVQNVSP
jgi:hypothetical protein